MDEISNKTLATLLVVAIVISLAGTFFAMRGVSQVTNIISGAQTATGTAKVNITETNNIILRNETVSFGSGFRNASYATTTECNLSTLDDATVPTCWINDSTYNPTPFMLENAGNIYVNISINSSTPTQFINGTIIGGTARYGYKVNYTRFPSSRDGCTAGATAWRRSNFTDFSNTQVMICSNLSYVDSEDRFGVEVNVSIPSGPTGQKTADVVFVAAKNY